MTSSPIISVALAVVISWALFAIFCSLIQESVAQLFAERGKFMKKYLLQQLNDTNNNINWAQLLYQHGSVDLLSRADNKPTNDISPSLFARALVDVVGNALPAATNTPANPDSYQHPALYKFKAVTDALQASDVASLLKASMMDAELAPSAAGWKDEGLIYQKLLESIENWYSELSERITLWYKKNTRQRLLILGVITAIILNVDSVQLFQVYNKNPDARNAVISVYEKKADTLSAYGKKLADKPAGDSSQDARAFFREGAGYVHLVDSLQKTAALPVGFDESVFKKRGPSGAFWIWKLVGVLLSGFAASLGAPFWFDLLKKAYSTAKPK